MIRDEIGVDMYGIRELSNTGVQGLFRSSNSDGFCFISKYNQPALIVMPLSMSGMKKAIKKFRAMLLSGEEQDSEFTEIFNSLLSFFEQMK